MAELSKNASKIMDLVKDLTIVELNDLVTAMEEEFGVSATPVISTGWAVDTWADIEDEKTSFNVVLTNAGCSKIAVIKVIREITDLGLREAKDLADNGGNVKEGVTKDESEEIKTKLVTAGAEVELK